MGVRSTTLSQNAHPVYVEKMQGPIPLSTLLRSLHRPGANTHGICVMYRKVEIMPHTLRPGLVDNSLSPHGGRLIERVATPQEIRERWPNGLDALPSLAVRDQIAQERRQEETWDTEGGAPLTRDRQNENGTQEPPSTDTPAYLARLYLHTVGRGSH